MQSFCTLKLPMNYWDVRKYAENYFSSMPMRRVFKLCLLMTSRLWFAVSCLTGVPKTCQTLTWRQVSSTSSNTYISANIKSIESFSSAFETHLLEIGIASCLYFVSLVVFRIACWLCFITSISYRYSWLYFITSISYHKLALFHITSISYRYSWLYFTTSILYC